MERELDAAQDHAPGRFLLVDDDEPTRELVASQLRRLGHEVDEVSNGADAVERAMRGGYDVAVFDAHMAGMGGVEACRVVKAQPALFLPVILLAARTDSASRIEGLRVGADDVLGKPLEERELAAKCTALLRLKQLHHRIAQARAQLDELSTVDAVSGLCNYRHLSVRLADEFKRSERYHDPLACLLMDVDRLRNVYELYGEAVGDQVLHDIAQTLRSALRDIDVVARYGSDEFLVLLPSTHFVGALAVSDRLWREVRSLAWPNLPAARVTLSIGVSMFPGRDVRTREQLLRAADSALLRSKCDGGDRICVFQHQGYIYSPAVEGMGNGTIAPPARGPDTAGMTLRPEPPRSPGRRDA